MARRGPGVKTLTIEVKDEVAERIEAVARGRAEDDRPISPEALAARWLSDFVMQRTAAELMRFRGLEDR